MHIISDGSLKREGYTYSPTPGGGFVVCPSGLQPHINWRHIDGPLLHTTTCRLHWLTLWERLRFAFGFETIHTLDEKHR